jgi:D-alanine-D-alanine ligase
MKKLKVGIIFGGKSAEHAVSLQSAANIYKAIDRKKYNPILIGISKKGQWFLGDNSKMEIANDSSKLVLPRSQSKAVMLVPQKKCNIYNLKNGCLDSRVDVVFPVLHGPFGEDGTVQGLLKLANIPFVGSGVLGSAVGMDKDFMKRLLRDAKIPIGKFVVIESADTIPDYDHISSQLGTTFFVKPANMGSSIGVGKVCQRREYLKKIKEAFKHDRKVVIEEYIEGREIECGVLGNTQPIASVPGEVISRHDFYSYEAKYIDASGAILEIPAKLSIKKTKRIQNLALKTFRVLGCAGLGRVDFFLKKNGQIIVNEINTIPGFTKISMYPKLWEASGISYRDLIDRLIKLALENFPKEKSH